MCTWTRARAGALLVLLLIASGMHTTVGTTRARGDTQERTRDKTHEHAPPVPEDSLAQEEEDSFGYVTVLVILGLCIVMIYSMLVNDVTYIPESVAIILFGIFIGLIVHLTGKTAEFVSKFDPETFMLFLLPPIIFESGYSLHKGKIFFSNLGSIALYAFVGTLISSFIIGMGLYALGHLTWVYPLSFLDSMLFASLLSAVDPVATLAIFNALKVSPMLHMLVFGESVLNDAVAIVLYRTLVTFVDKPFTQATCWEAIGEFLAISFGSVGIGAACALTSAIALKSLKKLDQFPSLEISLTLIFSFLPYLIAESAGLSGILAILTAGIIMAHYTHFNLSPVAQLTTQLFFRVVAFIAETFVFAFLGLGVFSFQHNFHLSLVLWTIVLCMIARAANIFPLTQLLNRYRSVPISRKHQFIIWFSGLRGAIAFSLSLNTPSADRQIIITTTLVIVLFTVLVFGGGTMPMLQLFDYHATLNMSKTADLGKLLDESEVTEMENATVATTEQLGWFGRMDQRYLVPYFRKAVRANQTRLRGMGMHGQEYEITFKFGDGDDHHEHGVEHLMTPTPAAAGRPAFGGSVESE